jgi:hypothetical protein
LFTQLRVYLRNLWETKTHCPFFYIPLISLSFAEWKTRKHNAFFFNPKKLENVESAERSLYWELCASLDLHFILFFTTEAQRTQRGDEVLFTQLRVYLRNLWETKIHSSFFFSPRNRREAQNQTTLKHNALYFFNAPRRSHEVKGATSAKLRGDFFTLLSVFLRNLWEILDL